MTYILPTMIVLAVALSQVIASPVIRIGTAAVQLSEQDVAEVLRTASSGGRRPWLMDVWPSGFAGRRSIDVYLAPDVETPGIRRGAVISVSIWSASAPAQLRVAPASADVWTVTNRQNYAQVVISGRSGDHVDSDHDLNRPFRVVGEIDDAELIDLVRFVRSSPAGPTIRGVPTSVHGELPITNVFSQTGAMEVRLKRDGTSWQAVRLRREGSGWVVEEMGLVIV